jgi:glycine/D-amino acid oxidase-like deaminating enzyme
MNEVNAWLFKAQQDGVISPGMAVEVADRLMERDARLAARDQQVSDLEAANAGLAKALERIGKVEFDPCRETDQPYEMRNIARAALAATPVEHRTRVEAEAERRGMERAVEACKCVAGEFDTVGHYIKRDGAMECGRAIRAEADKLAEGGKEQGNAPA